MKLASASSTATHGATHLISMTPMMHHASRIPSGPPLRRAGRRAMGQNRRGGFEPQRLTLTACEGMESVNTLLKTSSRTYYR